MTALTPMCFYSYQNISLLFEIAIGLNFANKALNYLLNHASVIKNCEENFKCLEIREKEKLRNKGANRHSVIHDVPTHF